jgi:CRP-like cAMP-binding protein
VVGLLKGGVAAREIVREIALFGVGNRDGWASGMTTLVALANLVPSVGEQTAYLALCQGARRVADDGEGQPPRRERQPLETAELPLATLKRWFRYWTLVRHRDGAERTLRTAIRGGASAADLADMVFSAATDRIYADGGHPYCAQALGFVTASAFPRETVQSLMESDPAFRSLLMRESARQLESALRELDVMAHRSTNGRVADKILMLSDKFGRAEPQGVVLTLRITQRELASLAGTNRESVCKALVTFKREGSIDIFNKMIVVKNKTQLASWP